MAYNTTHPRYKSSWLAAFDCTNAGAIKGPPLDARNKYYATFTVPTGEQMEAGECVGMIRIPADTRVVDAVLTWSLCNAGAILAVGDPFACGRFIVAAAHRLPQENTAAGSCGSNRLVKTGAIGDGCGAGYLYTCETDVLITVLYGDSSGNQGGWAGGAGPNSGPSGSGPAGGGGALAAGTRLTLILDVLPV